MTTVVIVALVGAAIYLAAAWHASRNEVSQLRAHIAALKRQLARTRS